jgi:hypothetical protein
MCSACASPAGERAGRRPARRCRSAVLGIGSTRAGGGQRATATYIIPYCGNPGAAGPPAASSADNGVMRRVRVVWQFLRAAAACLIIVAFSPLIVLAGEPLRRYVLAGPVALSAQPRWHRVRRRPARNARATRCAPGRLRSVRRSWRRRRFLMLLISNPLYIALTAPARWLLDRAGGLGSGPWHGRRPPAAGVREPRRPKPVLPSGALALAEPRTKPVIARLLGTVSGRPRRPDNREGPGSESRGRRARARWRRRTP